MAATFWTALSSSNAALCQRSPAECAQRAAQLAQNSTTLEFGREPKVLEAWSRLADGRVVGRLDARTVWLTVETEGRLASDPRSSAGYIETIGGRVYELGEPAASREASGEASGSSALPPVATSDGSFGAELQRWGVLKGVVGRLQLSPQAETTLPVLLSFALVGGLCFQLGASGIVLQQAATPPPLEAPAPPPPPPVPQTRTTVYPAAERVSLTVSEQRARQALRVAADEKMVAELRLEATKVDQTYESRLEALKKRVAREQEGRIAREQAALDDFDARVQRERESVARRLSSMELKLRQDEEGLVELTRVEVERGPGATAVQLGVFPASGLAPPAPAANPGAK